MKNSFYFSFCRLFLGPVLGKILSLMNGKKKGEFQIAESALWEVDALRKCLCFKWKFDQEIRSRC